jgi:hypothetical protein
MQGTVLSGVIYNPFPVNLRAKWRPSNERRRLLINLVWLDVQANQAAHGMEMAFIPSRQIHKNRGLLMRKVRSIQILVLKMSRVHFGNIFCCMYMMELGKGK